MLINDLDFNLDDKSPRLLSQHSDLKSKSIEQLKKQNLHILNYQNEKLDYLKMDSSLNSILSNSNKSQSQGLTISSNLRKTKKIKNEKIKKDDNSNQDNQNYIDNKCEINSKNSSDNIYDISINYKTLELSKTLNKNENININKIKDLNKIDNN